MYIKHYFNAKLVTHHTHISYSTKKKCELKYVHTINCCREFCLFIFPEDDYEREQP